MLCVFLIPNSPAPLDLHVLSQQMSGLGEWPSSYSLFFFQMKFMLTLSICFAMYLGKCIPFIEYKEIRTEFDFINTTLPALDTLPAPLRIGPLVSEN